MPGTDRLSASSFEDVPPTPPSPQTQQVLADGSELMPRATKTAAPAANPLQFIKVGPCDLYKAAQEQLKKVQEIKKVEKTVKEESEDWQSNLDHWKCSRRKRQEQIIDRVVEAKKLELEEHERNKRRSKTLSEMIQQRSEKGVGPRKMSIMTYPDEDQSDLTDLGIFVEKSDKKPDDRQEASGSGTDVCAPPPPPPPSCNESKAISPDADEYTYERAIEGYKSFAEKNVKCNNKPRVSPPKRGGRIGEKLEELQLVRLRSNSVSDVNFPKVDIHKRRSLFEVVESADTKSPPAARIAKDLAGASIVKQRLSSFDDVKDRQPTLPLECAEIEPPLHGANQLVTIKERLSSFENGCKESSTSNFSDEGLEHKEILSPAVSDREVSSPLGAETSESGIDMEESSLYTDENIDEVLGEDNYDAHDVPDSASELQRMRRLQDQPLPPSPPSPHLHHHEAVTRFDVPHANELPHAKHDDSVARLDGLIAFVTDDHPSTIEEQDVLVLVDNKECLRLAQDSCNPQPEQFSSSIASEILVNSRNRGVNSENLIISNQIVSNEIVMLPLNAASSVEPPKEKPPPPPVDMSDDEEAPQVAPKPSIRRVDSTKRIKKEIRKKRSNFLGIEGGNDDAALESEVAPPPNMLMLLEEERRLDQQLNRHRQSLSSDADSLEGNHNFMPNTGSSPGKHFYAEQEMYRQSICSEADSNHEATESRDSGVELERANGEELCWNESAQPRGRQRQRHDAEVYTHSASNSGNSEIGKTEGELNVVEYKEKRRHVKPGSDEVAIILGDKLSERMRLLEEEKLRLEWARAEEEGRRMADEERLEAKEMLLRQQAENLKAERERLEQEQLELARVRQDLLTQQQRPVQGPMGTNLRYSMPNLQDSPPPASNPRQFSSWSRIPSAENLLDSSPPQQQMSRPAALHALSAPPRPRLNNGEAWMQPKRKSDSAKGSYNYRHWLIQEAEHRRITEQQQRTVIESRLAAAAAGSAGQPPGHSTPPSTHLHPHAVMRSGQYNGNILALPPASQNHPQNKPLPQAIIQTLTQRAQSKISPKRRLEERPSPSKLSSEDSSYLNGEQERMLSVSGKKKCSHCGDELGRGAAMVIESLRLFYHIDCFKCCVCHTQLGDGLMGTDVRVRNNKLHCHNCYSSDDGVKFSCV